MGCRLPGEPQKTPVASTSSFLNQHFCEVVTKGQQNSVVRRDHVGFTTESKQSGPPFSVMDSCSASPRARGHQFPSRRVHQRRVQGRYLDLGANVVLVFGTSRMTTGTAAQDHLAVPFRHGV